MKLSSVASVRRLARMWVDLSDSVRKENLSLLDTEVRISVIEEMVKIRGKRKSNKS